jgi:hypothetical protein
MKRFLTLLLAAVMVSGLFAGCGAGTSGAQPEPQAVADALLEQIAFEETLSPLAEDEISYYVTLEDGVTGLMYLSSGSTAEEIAVFRAPDKSTATQMRSHVEEYLSGQRSSFADYLPAEAKRIDDAVLVQKGSYVVLCVSGQPDAAKSAINGVFAES